MRSVSRLHRLFGIEVSGQHFVLDVDEFQSLLGGRFGDRDHASHVVADVADFVERQRMLIVADRKNAVGIGRVFADNHGDHAVEFLGAAGVDALDARMRIGRMQNLANQHAGHAEIVGVLAGAGGLFRRVDHGGGLADDGEVATHFSVPRALVIPSDARNLLSAVQRKVTSRPFLRVPPQSPP